MIEYFFLKKNNIIKMIHIKGHALCSKKNNNIVCASVSTAIILTLNAIEIFNLKKKINYNLEEGNFFLKVIFFDEIINNLLKNLEYTLKDLKKSYKKNLKEK
jgi:uncharacterized protein YsxB (DUF464 family)